MSGWVPVAFHVFDLTQQILPLFDNYGKTILELKIMTVCSKNSLLLSHFHTSFTCTWRTFQICLISIYAYSPDLAHGNSSQHLPSALHMLCSKMCQSNPSNMLFFSGTENFQREWEDTNGTHNMLAHYFIDLFHLRLWTTSDCLATNGTMPRLLSVCVLLYECVCIASLDYWEQLSLTFQLVICLCLTLRFNQLKTSTTANHTVTYTHTHTVS